jgi:hypothetical protein
VAAQTCWAKRPPGSTSAQAGWQHKPLPQHQNSPFYQGYTMGPAAHLWAIPQDLQRTVGGPQHAGLNGLLTLASIVHPKPLGSSSSTGQVHSTHPTPLSTHSSDISPKKLPKPAHQPGPLYTSLRCMEHPVLFCQGTGSGWGPGQRLAP